METHFLKLVKNSIKNWYIPLIVGIVFILTGLYTFTTPAKSYLALAMIFSAAFILTGTAEVVFSFNNRKQVDNWGWTLVFGLITLIIGFIMIIRPEISIRTLPLYVGFVILFRSIAAISYSIDLKNFGIKHWGSLLFTGILGVLFSFVVIWNPLLGGLTIVVWTGMALITAGIYSVLLSFRLKKLKNISKNISKELKEKYESLTAEIKNEIGNSFNGN